MFNLNELITEEIHGLIGTEFSNGLNNLDGLVFKNEIQIKIDTIHDNLKNSKKTNSWYSDFIPLVYQDSPGDYIRLNVNLEDTVNKIYTYLQNYNTNIPYASDYYLQSTTIDDDINKYTISIKNDKLLIYYNEEYGNVNTYNPTSQYVTFEYISNELEYLTRLYTIISGIKSYKYFLTTYSEFKRQAINEAYNSYREDYNDIVDFFTAKDEEFETISVANHREFIKVEIDGDEMSYIDYAIILNNNVPTSNDPFDIVEIDGIKYLDYASYIAPGETLDLDFEYFDGTDTTTININTILDNNNLDENIDDNLEAKNLSVSRTYRDVSKVFIYNYAMDLKDVIEMELYDTEFVDDEIKYDDIIESLEKYTVNEQNLLI